MATLPHPKDPWLSKFSRWAQAWSGSSMAFVTAVAVVLLWLVSGPFFRYSDTWQLVINTGTTIVTFWMVFLIQRAQNNDARAMHIKLDEIIAVLKGASNRLIKAEELSEPELAELQRNFEELRRLIEERGTIVGAHSVEEVCSNSGGEKELPAAEVNGQPAGEDNEGVASSSSFPA